MSLHKAKPTSAGRRFVVQVKTDGLHKGKPYGPLLDKKSSKGGRNHNGRITVRHQGGGHKQRYRIIDFKRDKDGVPGIVERLEYDPNRSAHIALIKYADGERRYILAPNGLRAGARIISGEDAPIKPGNALPLRAIPVGTTIHNVEMKPGKGGQLVRSAGTAAQLAAREGVYATLRLRSGEMTFAKITPGRRRAGTAGGSSGSRLTISGGRSRRNGSPACGTGSGSAPGTGRGSTPPGSNGPVSFRTSCSIESGSMLNS